MSARARERSNERQRVVSPAWTRTTDLDCDSALRHNDDLFLPRPPLPPTHPLRPVFSFLLLSFVLSLPVRKSPRRRKVVTVEGRTREPISY